MRFKMIINYNKFSREKLHLAILNCEHSRWPFSWIGHTAIIILMPTGQLMVLESTGLNKYTGISGVQLIPLGTWLKHYNGKVFMRRLLTDKVVPQYKIDDFIKKYRRTSYPDTETLEGLWKLVASSLDFYIFGVDLLSSDKGDSIFCTELVIMLLQALGLFTMSEKTSKAYAWEFHPDDTRPLGKAEQFLIDCKFDNEVLLKG